MNRIAQPRNHILFNIVVSLGIPWQENECSQPASQPASHATNQCKDVSGEKSLSAQAAAERWHTTSGQPASKPTNQQNRNLFNVRTPHRECNKCMKFYAILSQNKANQCHLQKSDAQSQPASQPSSQAANPTNPTNQTSPTHRGIEFKES